MFTRRMALTGMGALTFLMTPIGLLQPVRAQPAEDAVALVKRASDQLVAIVNGGGSPQDKRRALQGVIEATVDVDDIAHFCLGRFWRLATPEQQAQYLSLFHDLLVTEIAGHLGEYQGVKVTLGLARASSDTEIVITTVERPKDPPTRVDWVVATNTGQPRIVDLLAEGTSLRLTKSADFTAYLARHQYNIHELVEGLRERIAQNG